jgi:ABC-type enterochelin transport system permease subunit
LNKDLLNSLALSDNSYLSLSSFIVSVLLSFILSLLLSKIYRRYSNSFSNPETLARVLPILSIGTTIIIAVVKSSLALSLGLVGALSIVRFRTPIKEPEELTYIFLTIAIGLATGANQYTVAIIGFIITVVCIIINRRLTYKFNNQNTISISIIGINMSDISKTIELVSKNSLSINFHNLSTNNNKDNTILNLSIVPKDFNNINLLANELTKAFPNCSINIIDNSIY